MSRRPSVTGFIVIAIFFSISPISAEELTLTGAKLNAHVPPVESFSLAGDLKNWPLRLWDDAKSLPSWENAEILSLGAGWSVIAAEGWDRRVRDGVAEEDRRMGSVNDVFSIAGHPAGHIGLAALLYTGSLFSQSPRLHEFSLDLINAFVQTDLSTQGLKYLFDSERPNGEPYGFPSGHTASSFALASVVQTHYGLFPGLVAYGLAGAVGWHRIDARKHDLSDVLGGAAIGYIIGKSVSGDHPFSKGNPRILPYSDPFGGGTGIRIAWTF